MAEAVNPVPGGGLDWRESHPLERRLLSHRIVRQVMIGPDYEGFAYHVCPGHLRSQTGYNPH